MRYYDAVIFDLDGTLLNTLEDLRDSLNYALKIFEYPQCTLEQVRSYVGNGAGKLVERALPDGMDTPDYIPVLSTFKQHYAANCHQKTQPYEGILSLMEVLNRKGVPMAVVSNKPDQAVKSLCQDFFGDLLKVAVGEGPGVRRKPSPGAVLLAAQTMEVEPDRCVYVGDSEVDLETAANAGMDCISVAWGFRAEEMLLQCGAKCLIHNPEELLECFPEQTRVLLTDIMPEKSLEKIRAEGCELRWVKDPSPKELQWAHVIMGTPTLEQLGQASNLRWLQLPVAGVDPYTKRPGFPKGVILTNASGAFGQVISEYVLATVLSLMTGLPQYRDQQRQAKWSPHTRKLSLVGKQVLVLGAGDIGTASARLFRPFGCTITGVRRVSREVPPEFDAMVTLAEAEELLSQADIVICALPDTPLTKGYLNRERLEQLKHTAILVNVGRGNLIDCTALAQLLEEGRIFGAALDVTDPEPLPPEHPLWQCTNAVITPHISGSSFGGLEETEERIYAICRENLIRYLQGISLKNRVNLADGYRQSVN